MKKYLQTLEGLLTAGAYRVIYKLSELNLEKQIQAICVDSGLQIKIDGMVGRNTIAALLKVPPEYIISRGMYYLNKYHTKNNYGHNDKNILMRYLGMAEGLKVHWNRTESTYTSPYGIYKKLNRNSKVIKYIDSLFKKYHIPETRQGAKKINRYLTQKNKDIIRSLAYELYMKNYMNEHINKILNSKGYGKSYLSFFSISVNGSIRRAYKALQTALGVTVDGNFGNQSLLALQNYNGGDNRLNLSMLKYMKKFYDYLIRKKPRKYKLYRRGWYNRLRYLGYKNI